MKNEDATQGNPPRRDPVSTGGQPAGHPCDPIVRESLREQRYPWALVSEKQSCSVFPDSSGDRVLYIRAGDVSGDQFATAAEMRRGHSAAHAFGALGSLSAMVMAIDRLELLEILEKDPRWMCSLAPLRDPPEGAFLVVFNSESHREIFVGRTT